MSLTSQLHGGRLGAWCELKLPGTPAVVERVQQAVRSTPPVRPRGRVERDHWATVGGMVGARLALWTEHSPPYPALLGAVRAGLVSRTWAQRQAGLFPTHAGSPAEDRALDVRPSPAGWVDTGWHPAPEDEPAGPAEQVLADMLAGFRPFTAQHATPGRFGDGHAEGVIARVLWVLNGLEDAYRGGHLPEPLAGILARPGAGVGDLVGACPADAVEEHLAILARDRAGGLGELAGLAAPGDGGRLGYADPVFVPHWADGDVLMTREQESTLIDAKTVVRVDDAERVARWVWQILTYSALDMSDEWKRDRGRADRWRIRRVGLFLARHGVLVAWDVEELWSLFLGTEHPVAIANTRRELRSFAEAAAVGEGALLLHPTKTSAQ